MHIESRCIVEKTKMVVLEDKGTCLKDIPMELRKRPCLEDKEVLEIVKIAKEVEKHFGCPQDMEWVVDKRFCFPENIFWVQTRNAKYVKQEAGKDKEYVIDLMVQLFR